MTYRIGVKEGQDVGFKVNIKQFPRKVGIGLARLKYSAKPPWFTLVPVLYTQEWHQEFMRF